MYTISYELNTNGKWKSAKFTLKDTINLGRVLVEMRAQPIIRNISYTKV